MSDTKNDNVIYIIRNDLDLPEYVGISNNVEKRFHRGHCRKITQHEIDNKKKITLIREAINTHGKDHFWYEILHKGSREDCLNLEDGFIKKHKTLKPDGFNQVPGGGNPPSLKGKKLPPRSQSWRDAQRIANIGKKASEETKDKMRKSQIGKKLSQSTKDKMRKSQIGKKASEETKDKLRKSQIGKKASEETKDKMRKSHLGKKASEETKDKMRKSQIGKKFITRNKR